VYFIQLGGLHMDHAPTVRKLSGVFCAFFVRRFNHGDCQFDVQCQWHSHKKIYFWKEEDNVTRPYSILDFEIETWWWNKKTRQIWTLNSCCFKWADYGSTSDETAHDPLKNNCLPQKRVYYKSSQQCWAHFGLHLMWVSIRRKWQRLC
jgi:hypothetical protein